MGFPSFSYAIVTPRFLLQLAYALAYSKNAICWLLYWIGLAQPESFSWQEFSEISSAVSTVSAGLIRKSLPVITFQSFSEKLCEMEEEIMCSVCLSTFEDDDEIRELCNCSHIFHRSCLDKWIDHHQKTCPLCRSPLIPEREAVDAEGGNDDRWTVDGISYLFGEDLLDWS